MCRSYLGQYEEALADLDDCIARDPLNYDWFWDLRGQVLMVLGRYPEAIASYRKLNSFAFWAYAFLAICHWRMGDKVLAAEAARQCLAARPGATVGAILVDPYRDPTILEDLRKDLLAIGIPEEPRDLR